MSDLKEKELQEKVTQDLKEERFYKKIEHLKTKLKKDIKLSTLKIDSFYDYEYAKRSSHVIQSFSNYELITGEKIKNISIDRSEKLFPDILLHNLENGNIIITELKVADKPARETLTELMGYIQEVKNHLPLLSDSDINICIIAPSYNDLLCHGLCSIMWSTGINILCLKYIPDGEDLKYEIFVPTKWSPVGQGVFPSNALQTYSITLHNYSKDPPMSDADCSKLCYSALELIQAEAVEKGVHGFAFIWHDGTELVGAYDFGLSICTINPYGLFDSALFRKILKENKSPLTQYLEDHIRQYDANSIPKSGMDITRGALSLLKEHCTTEIETFVDWKTYKRIHNTRFYPVDFRGFGVIDKYIRESFVNKTVRQDFLSIRPDIILSYTDTPIAFRFINELTDFYPFKGGNFKAEFIYKFGKNISSLRTILSITQNHPTLAKHFEAYYFWLMIDFQSSLYEVLTRATSTPDVEGFPKLVLSPSAMSRQNELQKSFEDFIDWFYKQFLKNDEVMQKVFLLGINFGVLCDEYLKNRVTPPPKKIFKDVTDFTKRYLMFLTSKDGHLKGHFEADKHYETIWTEYFPGLKGQKTLTLKHMKTLTNDICFEKLERVLIPLISEISPEVFHELGDFFIDESTYEGLIKLVRGRAALGDKNIAIIINSSGDIGTGKLDEVNWKAMGRNDVNYETHIYVEEHLSGPAIATLMTWEEFKKDHVRDLDTLK